MRPIAELQIELAERIAARLGGPRVRALHLPPRSSAKEAEFCALELEGGGIGFAYIRLDGTEAALRERYGAGGVAGVEAIALARDYAGGDPVERALGFATINALWQQLYTRAGWQPPTSGDPLGKIDPQPGEHIGMVGLFTPLLPVITQSGARLTVLELKPELVREEPNLRVTLDPAELATCEKVISTCAVMLNDTLDDVLAACRNARYVALVGPTAGTVPDALFERGVHALGGRRVDDQVRFLQAFHSGAKWGAQASKYVLTREAYPGLERLLANVA